MFPLGAQNTIIGGHKCAYLLWESGHNKTQFILKCVLDAGNFYWIQFCYPATQKGILQKIGMRKCVLHKTVEKFLKICELINCKCAYCFPHVKLFTYGLQKTQILKLVKECEGRGDGQVIFICCSETVRTFCASCVLGLSLRWHMMELWAALCFFPISDIIYAVLVQDTERVPLL